MVSNDVLASGSYADATLPDYEEVVDPTCGPTSVNEPPEDEQEDESLPTQAEEDDEEAQSSQELLLLSADDLLFDVNQYLKECEVGLAPRTTARRYQKKRKAKKSVMDVRY